jgi:2-hydroxy-3-oxopropionate reductase
MNSIAFVGLGIMGKPMAKNLVAGGFDVVGHNRSQAPIDDLIEAGGRGAANLAEAVAEADVVAVMVPDSEDVRTVLEGPGGVFAHARPGTLIIDFSSIAPNVSVGLAQLGTERGFRILDAPVSGGEVGAIEGTLSIMVGGALTDFDSARPILDVVGTTVRRVGSHGAGQTVKAANQLVVAGVIELVAEAIIFLEAHGVDMEAAMQVLAGGLGGNQILERKGSAMLNRRFEPGFRVALHHKDMGIVTSAAREAGVVIPLGATVAQLMASLNARGHGDLDHTALLMLVEALSGS